MFNEDKSKQNLLTCNCQKAYTPAIEGKKITKCLFELVLIEKIFNNYVLAVAVQIMMKGRDERVTKSNCAWNSPRMMSWRSHKINKLQTVFIYVMDCNINSFILSYTVHSVSTHHSRKLSLSAQWASTVKSKSTHTIIELLLTTFHYM
ncbi:CLUMA_CG014545, isoform A [Clunio marinus]|uniref:CLUMA_CG014545, isoform A n=1 Tax=Clunio marinus TaxID=568069 RepID=A0A1J1ILR9_9DIPT|nr:CLUMA_CG014545, isoform A [Clunio marinus]